MLHPRYDHQAVEGHGNRIWRMRVMSLRCFADGLSAVEVLAVGSNCLWVSCAICLSLHWVRDFLLAFHARLEGFELRADRQADRAISTG